MRDINVRGYHVGKITTGLAISVTGNPPTNRATATYVLTTNDGANIVVSEQAAIPYVEVLFEAGNGKYGYLNNATAWATGSEENNVISLNFWQVCFAALSCGRCFGAVLMMSLVVGTCCVIDRRRVTETINGVA